MVDTHSHILWDVDDGPTTLRETIKLLESAVEEGITEIISTSHYNHPYYDVNYSVIKNKINLLREIMIESNIPLKIHTGHEVRLFGNIVQTYKQNRIHTLANSNYLLIELPTNTVPLYTINIIKELLHEGIIPIIAHPELNRAIIEQPSKLVKLIQIGALAQITTSSLAGKYGRKVQRLSINLINANLIHLYGSDVHNLNTRPFLFNKGLHYLEKKKMLDAVDILLENNKRITKNQPLILDEPLEVDSSKWWKISM